MNFAQGPLRLRTVTFIFLENAQTVPMLKLLIMSTEAPLKHVGCLEAVVILCVLADHVCRVFTKECMHILPILRVLKQLLVTPYMCILISMLLLVCVYCG